jgi:hypothetical protein
LPWENQSPNFYYTRQLLPLSSYPGTFGQGIPLDMYGGSGDFWKSPGRGDLCGRPSGGGAAGNRRAGLPRSAANLSMSVLYRKPHPTTDYRVIPRARSARGNLLVEQWIIRQSRIQRKCSMLIGSVVIILRCWRLHHRHSLRSHAALRLAMTLFSMAGCGGRYSSGIGRFSACQGSHALRTISLPCANVGTGLRTVRPVKNKYAPAEPGH